MKSADNKTAIVTGASGGIGKELARCFAADGWNLVLVARDEFALQNTATELQQEYSGRVVILTHDLTLTDAPLQVFEELQNRKIEISALVNNAGFGDYAFFAESDWSKQQQMIMLNIAALTQLTHLFLPAMMERRNGGILNLASTAAYFPGPLMSVYYATKAYVLSFSHALQNELENSGVSATCLCPGPTHSGFQNRAAMTQSRLMRSTMMDAEVVARLGYAGFKKGKILVVPGAWNRFVIAAPRVFSLRHCARIIRRAQEKM